MTRVRLTVIGVAGLVSCLGLAAAIAAAVAPGPRSVFPAGSSQVALTDPEAAAQQDSSALLSRVPVPPGAAPASSAPVGAPQLASGTVIGSPDLVHRHSWWTSPGTMAGVYAWELAHRPAGASASGSGSGGGPVSTDLFEEVTWDFPPTAALNLRELLVTVAPDGNGTVGIRADAEVIYQPVRPAASLLVAARISGITVTARPGCTPGCGTAPSPFHSSKPTLIDHYVAVVNSLPISTLGVHSCAVGWSFAIVFTGQGARTSPTLSDSTGCAESSLSFGGGRSVVLADPHEELYRLVAGTLGISSSTPG